MLPLPSPPQRDSRQPRRAPCELAAAQDRRAFIRPSPRADGGLIVRNLDGMGKGRTRPRRSGSCSSLPISTAASSFWLTIPASPCSRDLHAGRPRGAAPRSPSGRIVAGMLLGGTPSPARSAWLRMKARDASARKGHTLSVESLTRVPSDRSLAPRSDRPGRTAAARLRHREGSMTWRRKSRRRTEALHLS
jgi:hypothetical protein